MKNFRLKKVSAFLIGADKFSSPAIVSEPSERKKISYQPFGFQRDSLVGYIGFASQLQERGSRFYILGSGYRVYVPTLYRLCSPDSYSPFGQGGINAYSYCQADPINQVDPSGHSPFGRLLRPLRRLFMGRQGNAAHSTPQLLATRNLSTSSNTLGIVTHVPEKSPAWTSRHILPPEGYTAIDTGAYTEHIPAAPLPRRRAIGTRDLSALEEFRRARGISGGVATDGSLSTSSPTTSLSSLDYNLFDLSDPPPAYENPPSYFRATTPFKKNAHKPYYHYLKKY